LELTENFSLNIGKLVYGKRRSHRGGEGGREKRNEKHTHNMKNILLLGCFWFELFCILKFTAENLCYI
jgi:hypothetical protein